MDEHTLRVLEFEKVRDMLMLQTAGPLGAEAVQALMPSGDIEVVRNRMTETAEACAIIDDEGSIPLGGIHDIRQSVKKASIGSLLGPHEMLAIHDTLKATDRLRQFLASRAESSPVLGRLATDIESCPNLVADIEQKIDQNAEVRDSASDELAKARRGLRTIQSRMTEKMNAIVQSAQSRDILQDPVITLRNDRYCVPVKSEYKAQLKGIVHDTSASGATLFVEPESIVEMGNKRKELAVQEREEIEKVLAGLTDFVGSQQGKLQAMQNVVGIIDCITARAKCAFIMRATRPKLNDSGITELLSARHPLLTGDIVPIDIRIGRDFKVLLITGPNTGGKTVALKTIGLLTIMSCCGMFIPCEEGSQVCVFKNIFVDIGDEQSIEQSLSTFSSHLKNIVYITENAKSKSLVLLDEIGAGTDPGEGSALAKAVIEYLLENDARLMATTHYNELKEYAFVAENIENASVEFDIETLRPTYKLRIGVPGSSNALSIASRLGLSKEIIEAARGNLTTEGASAEELIKRIEESHRQADIFRLEAMQSSMDAESVKKKYQDRLDAMDKYKGKMREKARKQAESVIDDYARKLDETLQKLATKQKDSQEAQALRKEAGKLIDELERKTVQEERPKPVKTRPISDVKRLKRGDQVFISSLNQPGEIMDGPDENGNVLVSIGIMKVTVPVNTLHETPSSQKKKRKAETSVSSISMNKAKSISPEIMLRGMRVEPAIIELDKYLDDALAAGLDRVRIIHGKGTGQMRSAVHEYLRSNRSVSRYHLADSEEGGDGATVVFMKR